MKLKLRNWLLIILITPIIVVLLISENSSNGNSKKEELVYSSAKIDEGFHQSPINIITTEVEEVQHDVAAHYNRSHEQIRHKEHTIEVGYDPGSYVSFDGIDYSCMQFHFHTPSEHLIDGVTYPMEVHFVHSQIDDDGINHYFVLAVMFKMGNENAFLREFIDNAPYDIGEMADYKNKFFNIQDLVKQELKDFYHYTGSLTTPPFTETVHWAVSSHILEASPNQIAEMNLLEGNNARHIQAVNGRKVEVVHCE